MRVLCIAAHCDDEVLGCGGALARHVAEGDEVGVLFLVSRRTSRDSDETDSSEMRAACSALGFSKISTYDVPDQKLDIFPILEITRLIEKEIDDFKPNIVYVHNPLDSNEDHRTTYKATIPATRHWRHPFLSEIRLFEIPPISIERPDLFVNIDVEKKIEALKCYKSELRKWPDPRSAEAVRYLAHARGIGRGGCCEAFQSMRVL